MIVVVGVVLWALDFRYQVPELVVAAEREAGQMGSGAGIPYDDNINAASMQSEMLQMAEHGDPDAEYRVGLDMLQRALERNEHPAIVDAVDWIHKAADQDHVHAELVLGGLYEKGRGVIQDYEEAKKWYLRAAMNGNAAAMLRVGLMYVRGKGVERDLVDAYVWLNIASARGDKQAEKERERIRALLSPDELDLAQGKSRAVDSNLPHVADNEQPLPIDF